MRTTIKIMMMFLVSLAPVSSASANVLAAKVIGVVNSVHTEGGFALDGSISVGSAMTGFCIYDTDTPDMDDSPHHGTYPVISLSMTIGNYTFMHDSNSPEPALWDIWTFDYCYRVASNAPRFDGIVYMNGSPLTYDEISWDYTYMEPIDVRSSWNEYNLPDTLPESIPFSTFNWERSFEVHFKDNNNNYFLIYGNINSLEVVTEPATLFLFALAGLFLRKR